MRLSEQAAGFVIQRLALRVSCCNTKLTEMKLKGSPSEVWLSLRFVIFSELRSAMPGK